MLSTNQNPNQPQQINFSSHALCDFLDHIMAAQANKLFLAPPEQDILIFDSLRSLYQLNHEEHSRCLADVVTSDR